MSDSHGIHLTRRGFLKSVGSIAGAITASSLLSACDTAGEIASLAGRVVPHAEPITVGVLVPRSVAYPALGQHLLAGMQLYADQAAGRPLKLLVEQVAGAPSDARRGALKLLEQRVDLLAGVMDPFTAAGLRDTLADRRKFLVVADVGANAPRASEDSPFIAYSSLGYWRASHSIGGWAAQRLGRRAAIATSFYESGYDAVYAFRLGFEAAGGQVHDTYVSHRPIDPADHLAPLLARIGSAQPDLVYAAYSGREAADFLRAYRASGLGARIPLVGASFVGGAAGLDMSVALPWAPSLGNPENHAFVAGYQAATGQAPDLFAVLGYDTAHLIDAAAEAAGDHRDIQRFQQALAGASFASPRGAASMDAHTRSLVAPLYLSSARSPLIEPLAAQPDDLQRLAALRSGTKTGWINAYMCV